VDGHSCGVVKEFGLSRWKRLVPAGQAELGIRKAGWMWMFYRDKKLGIPPS
jgi:hypothetical protein